MTTEVEPPSEASAPKGGAYLRLRGKAWLEFLLTAVAFFSLVFASLRLLPMQSPYPFAALESETHWVALTALLALIPAWRLRAKRRAVALSVALVVLVPWCLEWTLTWAAAPEAPSAPVARIRVMSTNLLAPRLSRDLAREIRDSDADVVLVQEASDEWWALLEEEGVFTRYPHRIEETHPFRQDYMGIAILSRLPIEASHIEPLANEDIPYARIDVQVAGLPLRLYSVHTLPPYYPSYLRIHLRQFAQLERMAREDIDSGAFHAVILSGDFNATPTSHSYRVLREAGFIAAHERVGRGFAFTWPNGVFWLPPMRLDHLFILEREANTTHVLSVREGVGGRSDHRPLFVDLAFSAGLTH
jgi:endonuclease/exonuclease/phosphatase (EEP) superfamily protein YafD